MTYIEEVCLKLQTALDALETVSAGKDRMSEARAQELVARLTAELEHQNHGAPTQFEAACNAFWKDRTEGNAARLAELIMADADLLWAMQCYDVARRRPVPIV